ncbi:9424_t:CDS:2, partial [Acaulospora morrowiae]
CEKSFTRPDSLTKHMKSQHGDLPKKRVMEEGPRTYKKRKLSVSPEEDDEDSHTSHSRQPRQNYSQHHNQLRNRQQPSDRSRQQQSSRQSPENPYQNRDYTSDEDTSVLEVSDSLSSD